MGSEEGGTKSSIDKFVSHSATVGNSSKPSGKELNSHMAIEKIGDLLMKMKGYLKNIGHKGSTVTAEEVDWAIEAPNKYKLIWHLADKMSPLEKLMSALEEVVKKGFEQTPRPTTVKNGSFQAADSTYALIVTPPATKAVVWIRVPGVSEMQPSKILSIAQQNIKEAYAIRQMRSNDTEVLVQSSTQRGTPRSKWLNLKSLEYSSRTFMWKSPAFRCPPKSLGERTLITQLL